jgi:hypothetical protein
MKGARCAKYLSRLHDATVLYAGDENRASDKIVIDR